MNAASRPNRVDDAYEQLKREILENRMSPGNQATELELAARLGMSRTPVHEALIRLEGEGLLELIPRHGARVLPVSPDDMREIYQLLTVLEPEAAADIARQQPGHDQLAGLEAATAEMERSIAAGDLDAWAKADDRFHRELLDLSSNRRLCAFVNTLFDQAHRARMMTLRLRQPPIRSTREHRAILRAIAKGDAEQTRQQFRAHRERAGQELLDILDRLRLSLL
ncbi:MAG: hypothetical protein ETSY1_27180 [Candidatus Entotheonella factor]|uniref:HTH gntR-type domain-containing protein n=1 Tax=Entotheonella factor TaxID=1429438 RepID=W4LG61_ENTF1|nr:GntR family transcriptional regulator [Candidatus Entotheonella palauensis]ETW96306.1 MAG: hypothetical protein ETSY1_27180 [Candidatus Entotheonella factor]